MKALRDVDLIEKLKRIAEVFKMVVESILFVLSISAYAIGIEKAITGFTYGLQGFITEYGYRALGCYFSPAGPMLFFFSNASICGLYLVFLIYQCYFLIKCAIKRRWVLFGAGMALFGLFLLAAIATEPLSKAYRTNRDIPEEVTQYLSDTYGETDASQMKVMIEKRDYDKRYDANGTYTYDRSDYLVASPAVNTTFTVHHLRKYYWDTKNTKIVVYEGNEPTEADQEE